MISVVIVNYNGKKHLKRCLSSLAGQTFTDYEVILVDNASSDGSPDFVKENFPEVRLIENKENLGFAGGTNSGIKAASGNFIMTLNNDTWMDPDCLFHLFHTMESADDVGMCAAKLTFPDGRINSTGICISRSGAAWDRGIYEQDDGQYGTEEEVFGPCAGAALYRRSMLEKIGLFDEDFFLYMEDVDLAFRARLSGWRCLYMPLAKVTHIHGGTAGVGSDLAVYYGNRNVIWYVLKNFPVPLLLTSLPWIIGRNVAVIPYYALRGQGLVILRAKFAAVFGIRMMLGKRGKFPVKVPDEEIKRWVYTWGFSSCKKSE